MAETNANFDLRESDRKQRMAMKYACEDLLRAIKREHPRIVRHLQSLPNAQETKHEEN